jgi:threonylcarbamoyladenosine tRNA methylthiotransferase MtaB
LRRVERIKEALDFPAFTTDIIVGFPGETEADFEATCRVVREVGFAKVHIFSYSARAGTPAARLSDAISPIIIAERADRLRDEANECTLAYQRQLLGRILDVLVEGADAQRDGEVQGTSCRFVPISFRGHAPALLRRIVPVRVTQIHEGRLCGEPEPGNAARLELCVV